MNKAVAKSFSQFGARVARVAQVDVLGIDVLGMPDAIALLRLPDLLLRLPAQ